MVRLQPIFFMLILGINSETITALAVATDGGSSSGCIYVLGTSSTAINLSGGETITANSCGVVDNGGLQISNGAKITAASIGLVGAYSGEWRKALSTPTPITGIVPAADPLASLTPPTPAKTCIPDPKLGNGVNATLSPGTYCALTIGGGVSVLVNNLRSWRIINGNFNQQRGAYCWKRTEGTWGTRKA